MGSWHCNEGWFMLAISNSGETDELNMIISSIRKIGAHSSLLRQPLLNTCKSCDVVIDVGWKEKRAFRLAPTSSSTASLAMGDALLLCSLRKEIQWKDFYKFHLQAISDSVWGQVRDVMILVQKYRGFSRTPIMQAIEEWIGNKGLSLSRRENCMQVYWRTVTSTLSAEGEIYKQDNRWCNDTGTKTIEEMYLLPEYRIHAKEEITTLVVINGKTIWKATYTAWHSGTGGT